MGKLQLTFWKEVMNPADSPQAWLDQIKGGDYQDTTTSRPIEQVSVGTVVRYITAIGGTVDLALGSERPE
jgi:hypothetical protein